MFVSYTVSEIFSLGPSIYDVHTEGEIEDCNQKWTRVDRERAGGGVEAIDVFVDVQSTVAEETG